MRNNRSFSVLGKVKTQEHHTLLHICHWALSIHQGPHAFLHYCWCYTACGLSHIPGQKASCDGWWHLLISEQKSNECFECLGFLNGREAHQGHSSVATLFVFQQMNPLAIQATQQCASHLVTASVWSAEALTDCQMNWGLELLVRHVTKISHWLFTWG